MLQVKQLHDWLAHWNEQFLQTGQKGKRKKQTDSVSKKAVLLSGSPGIGKTTSAKLVSQMLGFQIIEVLFLIKELYIFNVEDLFYSCNPFMVLW